MKKIILIAALLVISFVLKAQNIQGIITDDQQNPVEFAMVVLQTPDSTYINSTSTDSSGVFHFSSDLQSFRLVVQHLMYQTHDELFRSPEPGTIQLQSNEHQLDEVIVKGERPVIRMIEGRMTYDVPQLLEGKVVSNAYESLLQLPGISEQSGILSLAGSKSLTILINGRPAGISLEQLTELLKSLPKERIQTAEVMYSAPPQYHVRGAAVNLILAGAEIAGLQGQINGNYDQSHYADYGSGVSLLYNASKLSTDFMYSFGYIGERSGLDLYSHHLYNGQFYDITQHNRGKTRYPIHQLRLGNDYQLNDKNKLSLVYTTQITPWRDATELSHGTFSNSINRKETDTPIQLHNVQLHYSSGFGLTIGTEYTFYKSHTTQSYKENLENKEDAFTAQSKQDINKVSFYADQSHSAGDNFKLNYGVKFIHASDKSSQQYNSLQGSDLSLLNTNSKLDEYTYDMYVGFETNLSEKTSLSLSLTGEYYKHKKFHEWNLFPAFEVTHVADPSHIFQLSMSSDKTYPAYWEMINSISYLNGYTELHGNPDLRPYKDYSLQLSYILKNKYIVTAYAAYLDDYFAQLPYQSPERLALIYKTINFDYSSKIGLNVIIPFRISSLLDSRLTLNGFYDKAKSSRFHSTSFNNDNFTFYTSLNNTFHIAARIKAELNGTYTPKNIQGPSEISKMYRLDAGIKWVFAEDKAEIRLKANDIFNSWSPDNWSMKFDQQNLRMHLRPDSRNISLSFSYKFGGYEEKEYKKVDTSRFAK